MTRTVHGGIPDLLCAHCKHPQSEHSYPWETNEAGMCLHRAYANGARCNCAQFRDAIDKSRDAGLKSRMGDHE